MPRPKPVSNTPSAPQRYSVVLRTEGTRMRAEAIRLETEAKLLLETAELLDKQPATPKPVQSAIREMSTAA
jgi:hypothetical protein